MQPELLIRPNRSPSTKHFVEGHSLSCFSTKHSLLPLIRGCKVQPWCGCSQRVVRYDVCACTRFQLENVSKYSAWQHKHLGSAEELLHFSMKISLKAENLHAKRCMSGFASLPAQNLPLWKEFCTPMLLSFSACFF